MHLSAQQIDTESLTPVRVLIWDEQQPEQKEAYSDFLGEVLAEHLKQFDEFIVKTANPDDPEQGLSAAALNNTDVLVWWGHRRHKEITPETGQEIVRRVQAGELAFIALHSAHFATPFMEAMAARTRQDVERDYPQAAWSNVEVEYLPYQRKANREDKTMLIEPWVRVFKFPNGSEKLQVQLPNCVFPAWRNDGKPAYVQTLMPAHPIAAGIPATFTLPQTEMYAEPFHVPPPDEVVFEERWETGEWFRSGSVWNLGKGKVFYFRPGHETFPVFSEEAPLRIIENAVRWMGK
jgi:trehalose utilization protein